MNIEDIQLILDRINQIEDEVAVLDKSIPGEHVKMYHLYEELDQLENALLSADRKHKMH